MIQTLTILGAILIPCYEFILKLFPCVAIVSENTRTHKEMMAITIALAIGLSALYRGVEPFKNKWLFFFILCQLITINLMPKIPLVINGIDNSGFWVWKPLFEVICFLLMGIAISSFKFSNFEIRYILSAMFYVGLFQAVYVISQTAGFDQFFLSKPREIIGSVGFPERTGFLGQPTLVASFIAMCIPIGIYLKKYYFTLTLIIAILLTHSTMAIGAVFVGLISYISLRNPTRAVPIIAVSGIIGFVGILSGIIKFFDNGRFVAWKSIISDMANTTIKGYNGSDFSIFGHGLGSFTYLSTAFDAQRFAQAHNDYLEIFYCCGIVGIFFFLTAMVFLIKQIYQTYLKKENTRMIISLFCSFLIISICAFGSFVWQLGGHIFYTVVIVGLLLNENIIGGENV